MLDLNNRSKKGDVSFCAESWDKLNNEVEPKLPNNCCYWNVNQTNHVRDGSPNCWYVIEGFTQEATMACQTLSIYTFLSWSLEKEVYLD